MNKITLEISLFPTMNKEIIWDFRQCFDKETTSIFFHFFKNFFVIFLFLSV